MMLLLFTLSSGAPPAPQFYGSGAVIRSAASASSRIVGTSAAAPRIVEVT